jgi:hypothetical protein
MDELSAENQSDSLVSHLEKVCNERNISLPGEALFEQHLKLAAEMLTGWRRAMGSVDNFAARIRESILNQGKDKDKPEAWMKTETMKRTEKLLEIQILAELHHKHQLKLAEQGNSESDPYDYFFLHNNTRKVIQADERYRDDISNVEKAQDSARKMIDYELKRFRASVVNSAVC